MQVRTALAIALALSTALPAFADEKKEFPPIAKVVEGATVQDGLLKLHRKKEKLYVELKPTDLKREYLVLISLSRGIGEGGLLGGMSLFFGDDWILEFRRVDDRVHLVRKNVRFRADSGSPAEQAVGNSYTDSVLAALPIEGAQGPTILIDLSRICLSDFPGLSSQLSRTFRTSYSFDRSRSTYHEIKTFPKNLEIDVEAVYGTGKDGYSDTVPDTRGVQLGVHYSISEIERTSYRPRKADPRIGYFLTVVKDYTNATSESPFVRYVNRWNLEKADAKADPSPPKKPIIFHLEETIPYRWRPYVVEGILAWNKAFRKLGFANAIQVRDLPSDADAEDVRYNTFRWITTGAGFAMGPSRVNPRTGEILDADIIFDADMVRYWQMEYDDLIATQEVDEDDPQSEKARQRQWRREREWSRCQDCMLGQGKRLELGTLALAHLALSNAEGKTLPDEVIGQAVREVTMHEVGHTLGLRHNFKASAWKTLEEIDATPDGEPTVASVMDYNPANIVPPGGKQGAYFPTTIGPYDEWAIEYGYSVFSPNEETAKLAAIAARSGEPELAYATDEDTRWFDSDPLSYRFDMSKDPIAFAKRQFRLAEALSPGIVEKVTDEGEGYQKARRAFAMLLGLKVRSSAYVARFVGGQYLHRSHRGDANAQPPFVLVSADRQREALKYLDEQLFADTAFDFPAELLNRLAPNRWRHWGTSESIRLDYPLHEVVLGAQTRALEYLLDPIVLARILDGERRYPDGQEPFTLSELFRSLSDSIWRETKNVPGQGKAVSISSFRRALQREYVRKLIDIRLTGAGVPEDARALASLRLREIAEAAKTALDHSADDYAKAHLLETQDRIRRALEADFVQTNP